MRTFSRWMPPAPSMSRSVEIFWLGLLGAGATWVVLRYPWVLAVAVTLLALGDRFDAPRRRRLRALALARTGESLCTFARAFPRAERDAWILRAVHEELTPFLSVDTASLPLRPSDQLREDLEIDDDDLDDVATTIARRVGRDMRTCRANPLYGRVKTVGDLVEFIRRQPPVAA